jgi:branched-chain amino acid transport system permease protein
VQVLQVAIDALSLGGTYALLALGFAVLVNILNLINWAHGELITVGGYTALWLTTSGVPFVWVVPAVIAVSVTAALLLERLGFRPVRGAHPMTLLLTSFALSQLIRLVLQVFVSAQSKAVRLPDVLSESLALGSLRVGVPQLLSLSATLAVLLTFPWFLRRTRTGIAMRAAAEDFPVTRLMGVRANRVVAAAFAVSGALAGISAILLIAQRGTVNPGMGADPVIIAFVAAAIGGLGSLGGAAMAGFLYALIETVLQAYLPGGVAAYQSALVWVCLIVILSWRPYGLLGRDLARV